MVNTYRIMIGIYVEISSSTNQLLRLVYQVLIIKYTWLRMLSLSVKTRNYLDML